MGMYTLSIPGWSPCPLNKLLGDWRRRHRFKSLDREVIGRAALAYGVKPAEGKRRVRLHVVLPPKQRAWDGDALFKSLLDSLTMCGALRDDNPTWCVSEPIEYSRGEYLCSFVTLEDVA